MRLLTLEPDFVGIDGGGDLFHGSTVHRIDLREPELLELDRGSSVLDDVLDVLTQLRPNAVTRQKRHFTRLRRRRTLQRCEKGIH